MTTEPNSFGPTHREPNSTQDTESIVRSDTMSRAIVEPNGYVPPAVGGRFISDGQRAETVDFQHLMIVVMRRWKVILATLVTVLSLALAYALLATPIYQAEATVQIDTTQARTAADPLGAIAEMMNPGSRSVDTQIAILKGMPLQRMAFGQLSEADRTVGRKHFDFDVSGVGDTDLIKISVRTLNPKLSVRLANIICQQLIAASLKQNQEQVRGARVYVEGELQEMRSRLDKSQIEMAAFKRKNKTFDIGTESKALVDRLATLQAQGEQAESERLAGIAQLGRLKSISSSLPNSTLVDQTQTPNPQREAVQAQLTQYQVQLIQAQQTYTDNHPSVIALKNQIGQLETRLKGMVRFTTSTKANIPNAVKQTAQQEIARIQGEVWANEARGSAIRRAVEAGSRQLTALPDREYRLSRLSTDVSALQQAYNLLNEKYMTLLITESAKVSSASLAFATEKGYLVAPKRPRIMIIALFLGLLLSLALAAALDRLDSRVHSDIDAEMATRLPVLAHVPQIDKPGHERLLGGASDASNFTLLETFQMLRTNISFSMFDEPIRSVLVTSTIPGEGKSTSALNLAVAAAQSGERVILVDCDLRRPSVDRLLKLPNKVGFTTVVAGTTTIDEALQETSIPGLRIMTTGPTPPNPFRLLNSRAARTLLRDLRNHADFVVIDTPPALGMADAQLISTTTDAALLVVSTKGAKKHEIARTRELLSQTGVEMLGTILNRVQTGFGGYYGYGGYGYGYGYGHYYGGYAKEGNVLEGETEDAEASVDADETTGKPEANGAMNGAAKNAALQAPRKEKRRKS